jgi:hypothetical protein
VKKKLMVAAMSAVVGVGLLAGVASAAPGSSNASPKACFGQDRAAWIHANGGSAWGAIAPERAGDNAAINAAYRADCLEG